MKVADITGNGDANNGEAPPQSDQNVWLFFSMFPLSICICIFITANRRYPVISKLSQSNGKGKFGLSLQ